MSRPKQSARSRIFRTTAFCALMLGSSVSVTWYSPYLRPYSLSLLGLVGSLLLAAALCRVPAWQSLGRWLADRATAPNPWILAAIFLWGGLAPLAVLFWILDPIPHIPDGFAYLYQAKLFSLGKLWATPPALPEFFPAPWSVTLDGKVFSVFPPGWPILLSLGVKANAPWLINPMLGALALWAMWHLWCELFDAKRANLALILCALSPFFLFMSASFLSHSASLLASSVFALSFLKGIRKGSLRWGVLAGVAIGFHIVVRPIAALFVFVPMVSFFALFRRSRASWKITACSLVGSGLGAAGYLGYNRLLVGAWGTPPLYFLSPANRYGFGPDIGLPWASSFQTPGHGLWRALVNLNFNAAVMNNDLFGWPLASLAFLFVCLLFGRLAWQHRLCAGIIAAFVTCYAGYWYNGVAFGARFYYCLIPYLAILTVEGIRILPNLLSTTLSRVSEPQARSFVSGTLIFFTLYGLLVYIPRVSLWGPYSNQRKISMHLYHEIEEQTQKGDLVLVESGSDERYNPLFIKNDIAIEDSPVIYAWDRGAESNARLLAHFPERRVLRWRYPIERLKEAAPLARFKRHGSPPSIDAR